MNPSMERYKKQKVSKAQIFLPSRHHLGELPRHLLISFEAFAAIPVGLPPDQVERDTLISISRSVVK